MKQASTPIHIYREENATEFLPSCHLPALQAIILMRLETALARLLLRSHQAERNVTTLVRLLLRSNSQAGRKEKRRQKIKILFQNETYLKQIATHAASKAGSW